MKFLERIFRRLLWESQLSGEELASKIPSRIERAVTSGLALYNVGETLILYDPRPIVDFVAQADWKSFRNKGTAVAFMEKGLNSAAMKACIGMISMDLKRDASCGGWDCDDGPCGNASIVSLAASKQGYGPMLYDIGMYYSAAAGRDGMTPDRSAVSKEAEAVWNGMFRRPDIEKKQFVRRSPDESVPEDPYACSLHPPSRPALNYAYRKTSSINPEIFVRKHNEILSIISTLFRNEALGKEARFYIKEALITASNELFAHKYR
jgi:hypothetical protein